MIARVAAESRACRARQVKDLISVQCDGGHHLRKPARAAARRRMSRSAGAAWPTTAIRSSLRSLRARRQHDRAPSLSVKQQPTQLEVDSGIQRSTSRTSSGRSRFARSRKCVHRRSRSVADAPNVSTSASPARTLPQQGQLTAKTMTTSATPLAGRRSCRRGGWRRERREVAASANGTKLKTATIALRKSRSAWSRSQVRGARRRRRAERGVGRAAERRLQGRTVHGGQVSLDPCSPASRGGRRPRQLARGPIWRSERSWNRRG